MAVDEQRSTYRGADGTEIAAYRWSSSAPTRAVIQVAHGAGEHSLRYRDPLAPLVEAGYVVWSADHRGHGATASSPAELGDFGPGGADAAIDDMAVLSRRIRAEHPGVPLVLLGHSMGARFAQVYLADHSALIDALVLSGTAAAWLPRDPRGPNAAYAHPRTDYDWLSRDEAEVDRYIADPWCGIRFTPEAQASIARTSERLADPRCYDGVRRDLPIYVVVGDEDPVNDHLTRVAPLVDRFRDGGFGDVTFRVHPGARHEVLNETNRDEVVRDLRAWLDRVVG